MFLNLFYCAQNKVVYTFYNNSISNIPLLPLKQSKKKVLILGNMNANGLSLSTWISNSNFDITIFSFEPGSHWDKIKYRDYDFKIIDSNDLELNQTILKYFSTRFRTFLKSYDVIIGSGLAPLICYINRLKLDAFIPYGGDIRWLTNYSRLLKSKSFRQFFIDLFTTIFQTRGIQCCPNILMRKVTPAVMPHYIYEKFNIKDFTVPNLTPKYLLKKENKKFSTECYLLLCPTRHMWSDARLPSDKGQDILINGLFNYISNVNNRNFKVLFFEYGNDVEKSKDLVNKLDIDDYVEWLPKTTPDNVYKEIQKADLILLEGTSSSEWNSCHAQTIIADKPFIAYLDQGRDIYPLSLNLKYEKFENLLVTFFQNPLAFTEENKIRKNCLVSKYNESVKIITEIVNN